MREVVEIRSVGGAQGRVGVGVALRVYLCGEMVAAAAAAAVSGGSGGGGEGSGGEHWQWRRSATEVETAEEA